MRHRYLIFMFLFCLDFAHATPASFMQSLDIVIAKIEADQNLKNSSTVFLEFMKKSEQRISQLKGADQIEWEVAHFHLTPIQRIVTQSTPVKAEDCQRLYRSIEIEARTGYPEDAPWPELSKKTLQIAKALCRPTVQ